MRDFRRKPGRLGALPFGARVLYSIYLCFAVAALTVAAVLYQDGPTLDRDQVAVYYAGGLVAEEPDEGSNAPAGDGPALELEGLPTMGGPELDLGGLPTSTDGPELDLGGLDDTGSLGGTRIAAPFNERRLLEVTHGHLFMMPLFYLVIAHIFVLVGIRPSITGPLLAVGAASIALHIAGPWLVKANAARWGFTMPVSGIGMLVSLGAMAVVSLVALWLPRGRRATA